MKYNRLLSDYCRWNNSAKVASLLKHHSDLDLTIEEGICFIFAIKYQNLDMLNALINYYEKTELKGDRDSMEYKTAKYKLKQILEEATEEYNITSEIEDLLKPYVTTDDSSTEDIESLQNDDKESLDHFDNTEQRGVNLDNDNNHISSLSVENLREWNSGKYQTDLELIGLDTDTPSIDV